MKKLLYLVLIICLGLSAVQALPIPAQEKEAEPFNLDERNTVREKVNAQKAKDVTGSDEVKQGGADDTIYPLDKTNDSGKFDENTPKFKYEPVKEGEEPNDIPNLEDGLNSVNFEDGTEEPTPTKVINNTNKRFKGHKELKRKDPLEILPPDVNREMPDNGMSTPEQKTYSQDDYEQAYRDMQVPTFTFVHGIDPDQYYDMKDATWSPYPLFRLNSPLYFKTVTIPPGYYLLTPRQYKNKWYILFKEAGTVRYTIPVFNQCYAEAGYYHTHLKELDLSRSARWHIKFLNSWGKYIRKSKRRPAIQTNLELTDLDNNFLLIDIYYGHYKYQTIFRTEKF